MDQELSNHATLQIHHQSSAAQYFEQRTASITVRSPKTIKFVKFDTSAKFARINPIMTDKDIINTIDRTFFSRWKLQIPNLLISVNGGEKSFALSKNLRRSFRQDIIRASQIANAWIVTSGIDDGVTRHIGKAVRDYATRGVQETEQTGMICLGIVSHENLANREQFDGAEDTILYQSNNSTNTGLTSLEPNHTHFLLVDNSPDSSILEFRHRFERIVAEELCAKIPSCCLVLEGGPEMLKTLRTAVKRKIPIIIIKNSGRIADILAAAYAASSEVEKQRTVGSTTETYASSHISTELRDALRQMLTRDSPDAEKSSIDKWLRKIEEILENRDLITISLMNRKDITKDLMSGILNALFKVNNSTDTVKGVLKLSLLWDRVDLAQKYLFTKDKHWPDNFFNDIAFDAIVQNRSDFLKLLLRNQLSLRSFLGIHELLRLYNAVPSDNLLMTLINRFVSQKASKKDRIRRSSSMRRKISLNHIGQLIAKFFNDGGSHPYCDPNERYWWIDTETLDDLEATDAGTNKHYTNGPCRKVSHAKVEMNGRYNAEVPSRYAEIIDRKRARLLTKFAAQQSETKRNDSVTTMRHFDDPAFDLFIYCIFLRYTEMARVLFECIHEPIAAALTAMKLLQGMGDYSESIDERNSFLAELAAFETLACQVLGKCYGNNAADAHTLLIREVHAVGDRTCIDIALAASARVFISDNAVQTYANRLWYGRISGYDSLARTATVVMSTILPPLLLTLTYDAPTRDNNDADDSIDGESVITRSSRNSSSSRSGNDYLTKIRCFFNAPITLFTYSIITFSTFLIVLSYDFLINHNAFYGKAYFPLRQNHAEIFLIIFVVSYTVEESRQLLKLSPSLSKSIKLYFKGLWNIIDVFSIVLFTLAMLFGNLEVPDPHLRSVRDAGRAFYAMSVIAFYLKVLQWLLATEMFGPKVHTVGRMLIELITFWPVFMVFIVAWGIAQWGLLFPQTTPQWALIRNVIELSFWDLLGNTYLNIIGQQPFDVGPCTKDPALIANYTLPECPDPTGQVIVPIFLGIYMVLMNILLMNLLIALFNDVFNNKEITKEHWGFQYFELILEFRNKSTMLPPFTLIYLIYLLIVRALIKVGKCSGLVVHFDQKMRVPLRAKLTNKKDNMLKVWMCDMRDDCVREQELQEMMEPSSKLADLVARQKSFAKNIDKAVGEITSIVRKLEEKLKNN